MATASLGSTGYAYNKGWDEITLNSDAGYVCKESSGSYRTIFSVTLTPSNNHKITSFSITTGLTGSKSTLLKAYLYTSLATAKSSTGNPAPSGSIATGVESGTASNPTESGRMCTVTFSGLNITCSTTYYVWFFTSADSGIFQIWTKKSGNCVHPSASVVTEIHNVYDITYDKNGANGTTPTAQQKIHGTPLTLREQGDLSYNQTETNNYIITLDANGGTCNYKELTAVRTKSWTLNGWNTKKDGTGKSHGFSASYTDNAAATMYVKWGIEYKTDSIIFPEISRTGYTFGGWKIGSDTYNIGDSYIPSNSVTAIAQWSSNQYEVSFDGNDGTPGAEEITVNYGLTYGALPSASRTGYTFNGWFTSKTGGTKIYPSTIVLITENQTLYAQWTAFEYTVKYDTNGGSTTSNLEITATFDTSFDLISNISKDTFDFKGWNTKLDGSGTMYSVDEPVTNLTTIKDGVVKLYAIWEASPYKVTYNVYGNEYIQENVKQDSDLLSINDILNELQIKLNNWDRFDSWIATGNEFTDLIITINDNIDDLTKVAVKNKSPRTVTLNANIKPRFKIVYYNNGRWHRLSAIRYDNIWKKITPNINK